MYGVFDSEMGIERIGSGRYQTGDERSENARIGVYRILVADYIIKLFNSIDTNPKNAQLICTAHNVMLMDEDLRRDQIYFTSKDKYGESSLVSLSDYKNVRKTDLFSKRYLAGFYAKLPDMLNKD